MAVNFSLSILASLLCLGQFCCI